MLAVAVNQLTIAARGSFARLSVRNRTNMGITRGTRETYRRRSTEKQRTGGDSISGPKEDQVEERHTTRTVAEKEGRRTRHRGRKTGTEREREAERESGTNGRKKRSERRYGQRGGEKGGEKAEEDYCGLSRGDPKWLERTEQFRARVGARDDSGFTANRNEHGRF